MTLNGVEVADTFAEAFPMVACRLIVTAAEGHWVSHAAAAATGYAASVIGCDAEAGAEWFLPPNATPDGRPGRPLLYFAFSRDALQKAVVNRVGQCVMTCPTTACFDGLTGDPGRSIKLGGQLRYFGDGRQISKLIGGLRYWRLPTMDGEFIVADEVGTVKAVAGGNLIILGESQEQTLRAAEKAAAAARAVPNVILPFPGGVVRSGSKVGSKYPALRASTNEAYCPTLRGVVLSELPAGVNAAYEIVIDGLTLGAVAAAMKAGLYAAAHTPGIRRITAGNYGGKLGSHHIHLKSLCEGR